MSEHNHHSIREAIHRRITAGEWPPGELMPAEARFAEEYGCSRATVNRALQKLADDGLIERKRRAGTRVRDVPEKQARLRIPVIRQEIETAGGVYRSHVILHEVMKAPDFIRSRLNLERDASVLHLQTVHLSDGHPHAYEDRWVNLEAAPGILDAPLDKISANEWLIREVPYSSGEVRFSACAAGPREAEALETAEGAALFTIERATWFEDRFITTMKLFYRPGYHMWAEV